MRAVATHHRSQFSVAALSRAPNDIKNGEATRPGVCGAPVAYLSGGAYWMPPAFQS